MKAEGSKIFNFILQLNIFFEAYPINGKFRELWHWDEVIVI